MGKRPEAKSKRLFYRRAVWSDQNKETLEDILKSTHAIFTTTSDRTFKGLYGAEIQCARYTQKENVGLFFQIASYVPGQSTSAIEKSSKESAKSDVSEVVAPDGNNFLDGDVFLFVNKNDVILLQSGARENVAVSYMSQIFEKNALKVISHSIELHKIAKVDKIKMISEQGVKSIELNSSLYEASIIHSEKSSVSKNKETRVFDLTRSVAKAIKDIFSEDETYKEISEKENLNIKLSITFDGAEAKKHKKDTGFGTIGKSRLEKTSEKLVSESSADAIDGFVITTGDGNKISHEDIVISDNFRVKTFGNSLDTNDAFDKLEDYYLQLKSRGLIST